MEKVIYKKDSKVEVNLEALRADGLEYLLSGFPQTKKERTIFIVNVHRDLHNTIELRTTKRNSNKSHAAAIDTKYIKGVVA